MHVRCRSIVIGSLDDGKSGKSSKGSRVAKDEDGKRIKIPADMNYSDWKKVYIDKTQTLADWRKAKDAENKILREKALKDKINASFTPAKNIKGANEFAVNVLGIPQASYKGCQVEVANEWNKGLFETFTKYPELKNNFGFVGECHERNSAYKSVLIDAYLQDLKKRYPQYADDILEKQARKWATQDLKKMAISTSTIAQSWSLTSNIAKKFRGVTVNRDFAKDLQYFLAITEQSVKSKFNPVGCTTIRSHLDHEVGHQLDDLLGLRNMPEIQKLFDSRVVMVNGVEDFTRITNDLSKYAWENDNANRYAEFIAEAWSEYCNNPKPREIAQKIGEIIEREYNKKFP